ncbi:hypothetical protein BG015_009426 [Linnemannia schmuckeri]|uniref:Uncharacterized protein n=1 Tax=Linnemannia schmuckeri TaxID=64567 RepID=A0A9P5S5L6_9FUNG|nr:hypothetical protein BG015_009426 [Linnemannia schmuckeri]
MSMIRASTTSTTVAKRLISSSARANAAVAINHTVASATPSTTANGAKTAKTVAYAVLGSTAVVAGVSHLLKDEVVYWTPNK